MAQTMQRIKLILVILKLLIAVFIFSFLNISFQTGPDTLNSVWNFIYRPNQEFVLLTAVSYLGILLLIFSSFNNSKMSMLANIIGLCVLHLAAYFFQSGYSREVDGIYYSIQMEELLDPKYLFVLTMLIITLRIYGYKLNIEKSKTEKP